MEPTESAGRWTQEEHAAFLRGMQMFGRRWTKVAQVVGSRTTVQVRSHAQKWEIKRAKEGNKTKENIGGDGAFDIPAARPGGIFDGKGAPQQNTAGRGRRKGNRKATAGDLEEKFPNVTQNPMLAKRGRGISGTRSGSKASRSTERSVMGQTKQTGRRGRPPAIRTNTDRSHHEDYDYGDQSGGVTDHEGYSAGSSFEASYHESSFWAEARGGAPSFEQGAWRGTSDDTVEESGMKMDDSTNTGMRDFGIGSLGASTHWGSTTSMEAMQEPDQIDVIAANAASSFNANMWALTWDEDGVGDAGDGEQWMEDWVSEEFSSDYTSSDLTMDTDDGLFYDPSTPPFTWGSNFPGSYGIAGSFPGSMPPPPPPLSTTTSCVSIQLEGELDMDPLDAMDAELLIQSGQ